MYKDIECIYNDIISFYNTKQPLIYQIIKLNNSYLTKIEPVIIGSQFILILNFKMNTPIYPEIFHIIFKYFGKWKSFQVGKNTLMEPDKEFSITFIFNKGEKDVRFIE